MSASDSDIELLPALSARNDGRNTTKSTSNLRPPSSSQPLPARAVRKEVIAIDSEDEDDDDDEGYVQSLPLASTSKLAPVRRTVSAPSALLERKSTTTSTSAYTFDTTSVYRNTRYSDFEDDDDELPELGGVNTIVTTATASSTSRSYSYSTVAKGKKRDTSPVSLPPSSPPRVPAPAARGKLAEQDDRESATEEEDGEPAKKRRKRGGKVTEDGKVSKEREKKEKREAKEREKAEKTVSGEVCENDEVAHQTKQYALRPQPLSRRKSGTP